MDIVAHSLIDGMAGALVAPKTIVKTKSVQKRFIPGLLMSKLGAAIDEELEHVDRTEDRLFRPKKVTTDKQMHGEILGIHNHPEFAKRARTLALVPAKLAHVPVIFFLED